MGLFDLLHVPLLAIDAVGGNDFFLEFGKTLFGMLLLIRQVPLDRVGNDFFLLGEAPLGDGNARPIRPIHVAPAGKDHEDDDHQLDGHERSVGPRTFADAEHEDGRDDGHDQDRGEIEDSAAEGVVGQGFGNLRDVAGREQLVQVARPGRGHRGAAHGVFEDQVPADDPGEDFAQRGVGIGVGAAGHGGHGGELGVAQGGQGAAHAGDGIGQDHARPGIQGRGPPGDDEDARADNAAHAQRRQRPGAQHAVQAMLAGRLGQQCFQVLPGEDVLPVHSGPPSISLVGAFRRRKH